MKQLFKTFTMLLFVGVLFTNKLNAQITLEHTFEGDVYKSALLPANIERLKKQLEAVSCAHGLSVVQNF